MSLRKFITIINPSRVTIAPEQFTAVIHFALLSKLWIYRKFVTEISLGTAFCSIKTTLMWTMPMANSIIWLHYTKYFREPVMPMSFSVSYLAIFIAVLLAFCFIAIRKFNYDNVAEIAS